MAISKKQMKLIIKQAIMNVNESLRNYEADWVSLKRCPYSDKERVSSLRQFLECRLNMEFYYIPEFTNYVNAFEGHLIEVDTVIGVDERRRRFEYAVARFPLTQVNYIGDEDFEDILENVKTLLGGSRIKFTYSVKRPKINIEK